MNKKFQEFQDSYENSVSTIKYYLEPGPYEPHMHELIRWMMETDANPYAYLQHQWAGCLDTADGFCGLISHIHHAIYDDGDITFVKVNDQPRIVFARADDENFRDVVLTETEKHMERDIKKKFRVKYDIEILDIKPNEFGVLYDEYHVNDIKRCFCCDAGRCGIEFAVESYKQYKCFNESWVQELDADIKKWRNFYDGMKK